MVCNYIVRPKVVVLTWKTSAMSELVPSVILAGRALVSTQNAIHDMQLKQQNRLDFARKQTRCNLVRRCEHEKQ